MYISTIVWNSKAVPPDEEELLVHYRDERGDSPSWYITSAVYINGVWIKDNERLCGTVARWARMPRNIMALHDNT